jgi:hypothetical protein
MKRRLIEQAERERERGRIEAQLRKHAAKSNKGMKKSRSKASKRDAYARGIWRVRSQLRGLETTPQSSRFDRTWAHYQRYVRRVQAKAPEELCLRDKDRFLWAKSWADQLRRDIAGGFRRRLSHDARLRHQATAGARPQQRPSALARRS